ncbi:MAG: MarR family transcriptional regulator [FCB group bacterium]|nr:MarR family transcriptional regulator [FCB group bacterium]
MNNNLNQRLDEALLAKWAARREFLIQLLKKNAGDKPLTPEQFTILDILKQAGHGLAVKNIADHFDLPHANITRTLDRLEQKGLVRRNRDKIDGRQVIIRLTLEGSKSAGQLKNLKQSLYEFLWDGLDDRDKARLLELLSK